MPTIKIELKEGKDIKSLIQIKDLVMDAVVESLQLPTDDRNIRVMEYKPELFQMKPPYEVLIEINMFAGRTKEAKKVLYQNIVNCLSENNHFTKEQIFIILSEIPMENWGVRGGVPADEIKLDFKVNI